MQNRNGSWFYTDMIKSSLPLDQRYKNKITKILGSPSHADSLAQDAPSQLDSLVLHAIDHQGLAAFAKASIAYMKENPCAKTMQILLAVLNYGALKKIAATHLKGLRKEWDGTDHGRLLETYCEKTDHSRREQSSFLPSLEHEASARAFQELLFKELKRYSEMESGESTRSLSEEIYRFLLENAAANEILAKTAQSVITSLSSWDETRFLLKAVLAVELPFPHKSWDNLPASLIEHWHHTGNVPFLDRAFVNMGPDPRLIPVAHILLERGAIKAHEEGKDALLQNFVALAASEERERTLGRIGRLQQLQNAYDRKITEWIAGDRQDLISIVEHSCTDQAILARSCRQRVRVLTRRLNQAESV